MYRLAIVIWMLLRFGIDEVVLSLFNKKWRQGNHQLPPAIRLRLALEKLGPLFVKFGQQLSTRGDLLPAAYISELQKLQDQVPPEPPQTVKECLEHHYQKNISDIFSDFNFEPVGSASVAQVHRAVLCEGNQTVAVKVLRPAIHLQLKRDIRWLKILAKIATWLFTASKRIKPMALVCEFEKHLTAETDLLREASSCAEIYRQSQGEANWRVPKVYWKWCNKSVMVMEYIESTPLKKADFANLPRSRSDIAKDGIRLFFNQVFRDNFFHADMHPGNIHLDAQGRIVYLDYGIVGQLSDFDTEYLLRNFVAFFNRDYRRVAAMHVEAGWVPPTIDVIEFEAQLRVVCDPIFAQPLKNISFGVFLLRMFQTARQFDLEVQPQLILLQKTLLNVEDLGRFLDPDLNMWEVAKPIVEHWAAKQYNWHKTKTIIQSQLPNLQYLLSETPLHLRTLIQQSKTPSPKPPSKIKYFTLGFVLASLLFYLANLSR